MCKRFVSKFSGNWWKIFFLLFRFLKNNSNYKLKKKKSAEFLFISRSIPNLATNLTSLTLVILCDLSQVCQHNRINKGIQTIKLCFYTSTLFCYNRKGSIVTKQVLVYCAFLWSFLFSNFHFFCMFKANVLEKNLYANYINRNIEVTSEFLC